MIPAGGARPTLADYSRSKDNNFNLIRFLAASTVLFCHCYLITGSAGFEDAVGDLLGMNFSVLSVDTFFITSGFLVTGSLLARKDLGTFLWARALRIYPAFCLMLILCAAGLGIFFTDLTVHAYVTHEATWTFLIRNAPILFGIQLGLPGVFQGLPVRYAVNASMWTMPWELRMYAILAVLGLGVYGMGGQGSGRGRLKESHLRQALVSLGIASAAFYLLNRLFPFANIRYLQVLLRFLSMFFLGAAFQVLKEKVVLSHRRAALVVLALAGAAFHRSLFIVAYVLLLPYLVLYLAYIPRGLVRGFNRFGDYSYGIYIYAFPIQQAFAALNPGISVLHLFYLSYGATFGLAVLSWHLLEKRMLRLKA